MRHEPASLRRRALGLAAVVGGALALTAVPPAAAADGDLVVEVQADQSVVPAQATITWTITLRNVSAVALTGISWEGSLCGSGLVDALAPATTSAPVECTSSASMSPSEHIDTQLVTADAADGTTGVGSADVTVRTVRDWSTTSYGYPAPLEPGQPFTWHLDVTNAETSNTDLDDIRWSSSACGDYDAGGPLAPGDSTAPVSCDAVAPGSGEAVNDTRFQATVPAIEGELDTTVHSTVRVLPVDLTATLVGPGGSVAAGAPIVWTFQLANTGEARLVDPSWTSTLCPAATFSGELPAASATPEVECTTVAPAGGSVVNVGVFRATVPLTGEVVERQVTAGVAIAPAAATPGTLAQSGVATPLGVATGAALAAMALGTALLLRPRRARSKGRQMAR